VTGAVAFGAGIRLHRIAAKRQKLKVQVFSAFH